MTVRDIAITGVETAGPNTTAEALAITMEEKDIGSVVIEEDMRPIGIVTDRDLAMRVLAEKRDPAEVTAGKIMTPDPATIPTDAGVFELTEAMAAATVRRMPVVEDGELVGIVTMDDLVTMLVDELDNLGSVVAAELTY